MHSPYTHTHAHAPHAHTCTRPPCTHTHAHAPHAHTCTRPPCTRDAHAAPRRAQNNAVDIYENYFEADGATDTTSNEAPSAKTLAAFKDPSEIKRTACRISWFPDGGRKIAVAFSIMQACCVLRATCRVLRAACCCVLRAACYVLRAACCVLRAACCVPRAACRVPRAACTCFELKTLKMCSSASGAKPRHSALLPMTPATKEPC